MREGAISIKKAEGISNFPFFSVAFGIENIVDDLKKKKKRFQFSGVYFWDENDKRYIDWNSQAMCVNLGHSPDKTIIDAVVKQMETQTYSYPCKNIEDSRPSLLQMFFTIVCTVIEVSYSFLRQLLCGYPS